MTDYTNTPIGSGYNTNSAINTELTGVETAVNSKLDKAGGTMTGALDMNSKKLLNVAEGTAATDGVNYGQLVTSSAGSMPVGTLREYSTLTAAIADAAVMLVGDKIWVEKRTTGNGGGGWWKAITSTTNNGYEIVDTPLNTAISLSLVIDAGFNALQVGLKGDDTQEDFAAWDNFLVLAKANRGLAHVPGGTYNFGYAQELEFVGNSLVVYGDGARSNSDGELGTFIKAKVTLGTTSTTFYFARVRDIMIAGPGYDIFPSTASHDYTGIEVIKGVETKLNNVTVEGFKYGMAPYDDATISILANWNMGLTECRLYNNSICELEWGRGGHALHVQGCDIQIGQHLVVLGVMDHTTDTVDMDNSEPVSDIVFDGANTFQSATDTHIVITNSKPGVRIVGNYFEAGATVSSYDEYIAVGSGTATALLFNGFEDTAMAPTIDGNFFQLATNVLTYNSGFTCIRPVNVNGGSISNNQLSNVGSTTITAEERDIYLVDNSDTTTYNRTKIEGNIAVKAKDQWRDYIVLDEGYSTVHNTNLFKFDLTEQNNPNTLMTVDNICQQHGRDVTLALLGGTGVDDPAAQWGAVAADAPALIKIGPSSAAPTTGDYRLNSKTPVTSDTGWHASVEGTFTTLTGVTGTGTSGTDELTVNILDTLAVGNIINVVGSSLSYEVVGIETLLLILDQNLDISPSGAAVSYKAPTLIGYGSIRM